MTERTAERAFPKVDALFDGEPPLPPLDPSPRLRRITLLLVVAAPLDLLGITCFTGVPGAALTLVAYLQADAEQALVDAGRYPSDQHVARLVRVRRLALWLMVFTLISLALQVVLFVGTNFYTGTLLPLVERLVM